MIPVVGAVADVANGAWYAAEGDYLNAGISFAGCRELARLGLTGLARFDP